MSQTKFLFSLTVMCVTCLTPIKIRDKWEGWPSAISVLYTPAEVLKYPSNWKWKHHHHHQAEMGISQSLDNQEDRGERYEVNYPLALIPRIFKRKQQKLGLIRHSLTNLLPIICDTKINKHLRLYGSNRFTAGWLVTSWGGGHRGLWLLYRYFYMQLICCMLSKIKWNDLLHR